MRWTQIAEAQCADERRICGRRSRVVLTPRRWRQVGDDTPYRADEGGKKARSPGRARRKPLKPLRREGRILPVKPVVTNSCAFLLCARGCGCIGHPAFPAPSALRGREFLAELGRCWRRGGVDLFPTVIPDEAKRRSGISRFRVWC